MTSRLERLFVLLETGTSSATRRAAASQLGDVARAHPAELPRLLARLARVLRSPQWETRVAAGAAVEAILAHLPNQFLKVKKEEESADVKVEPEPPQQPPPSNETPTSSKKLLSFTSFDVVSLLTPPQGTTSSHFLMASSTSVFDESTSTTAKSLTSGSAATSDLSGQKTTAAEQRSAINKRLGLDIAEKMGILDSSDIVSNEDLLPMEEDAMTPTERAAAPKFVLPTQLFDPDMSSRELNAAKRRARKQKSFEGKKKVMRMSSTTSNNAAEDGNSGGSSRDDMEEVNGNADGQPDEEENSQEEGGAGQWPLQRWVDVLLNDIFAPQWEIRHGAATALREVLKSPAAVGGGRNTQMTTSQSDEAHKEWLEDLTLRLVSVLALDRFGDYVSDGVVAPVRESVAQCVGAAAALMNSGGQEVIQLVKFLAVLLKQKQWEVRHGALLALKYLLAVKQDAVGDLLPLAFPPMLQALREDAVDDVTAAAASALLPVAHILTKSLGQEAVSELLVLLWGSLPSLDDLSSAAAPSLALLAVLPQVNALSNLPALLPFLSHASSSVRRSALVTLHKLLLPPPQDMKPLPRDNGLPQSSLQSALRLLFQRALLEPLEDVASYVPPVWRDLLKSSPLSALLHAACPLFGTWLALAMTPPRAAIDPPLLHRANPDAIQPTTKVYMGGSPDSDSARTRMMLAEMLGMLAPYIVKPAEENQASAVGGQEPPLELFVRLLLVHLGSRSALQRSLTSFVISWWPPESSEEVRVHIKQEDAKPEIIPVKEEATPIKAHPDLKSRLHALLTDTVYFDEVAVALSRLQSESRDLAATLRHYSVPVRPDLPIQGLPQGSSQVFFTLSQIEYLAKDGGLTEAIRAAAKRPKVIETLIERRRVIEVVHSQTVTEYNALSVMTGGAVASAVVSLGKAALPPKLAPVVKPLMESLRSEHSELFQKKAADALVTLMTLVVDRDPCPNSKIVGNLVGYVTEGAFEYKKDLKDKEEEEDAIISLKQMNAGEVSGSSKKGPQDANDLEEEKLRIAQEIRVRGGSLALRRIAEVFGPQVWSKVSKLWDVTFGVLEAKDNKTEQEVLSALLILEIIAPSLHSSCWSLLEERTPKLCALLLTAGASSAVRHHTARALAAWGALKPSAVLPPAALALLPALGSVTSPVSARAGAMETLWALVSSLGLRLLPYVSLFVLPALSAMSDPAGPSVRALAAVTFATLVRLLPLDGAPLPDLPDVLPPQLLSLRHQQRAFLDQLLNPANIPAFKVTSKVKAELRPYQQAGVDWLAFLRRFGLHGILADDMGLGKTLQAIAILASHHAEEKDSSKSLVVCPPTLTGHWVYEVEKFVEGDVLRPLHYHGAPGERTRLQGLLSTANLLVASYDIVRNDLPFFAAIPFHFVILDEGHVIKNGKTKISKAMKELNSKHRLILTGTPIQNGVLELHSLFDFLMPGFLGSEKSFHARFSRPILAARDPKASPKDQEGGALALETLHRTALPFLLRRLKEDVLADLPPKVTQDYYCDLSPIQVTLYEDFARTRAAASLRTVASSGDDPSKHTHIFQALQYLRKVVNHPKLVLSDAHPLHATIMAGLAKQRTTLNDISIAAKLPALKQLLLDCGIGVTSDLGGDELGGVVAPHRALIFCQLKAMLDIVEKDLLKVHLPSVTFLRLDGSVPAGQRHSLVQRFNNDPSIDLLLLTTQVGGLGLNLTGADTVIFVEHDWNPMRDLQAMDRAHRIGQRRTVNVYRLITRATLEEKIMGLQKFKLMTARTVISEENARLETMGTEGLLDLFVLDEGSLKKAKESQRSDDAGAVVGTYRSVLEALPELWDDSLYDAEYDLSSFIKTLKST